MDIETKQALVSFLAEYITTAKRQKIEHVLNMRTNYISIVLENLFQPHNASAVIRSAECFGVQDVYAVQSEYPFHIREGVARGSDYWIRIIDCKDMPSCFQKMRQMGYRIVATTPHMHAVTINELSLDQRTALVFGTELTGISAYTKEYADAFVNIPMFGFTESLNVSVSVGICLYEIIKRLHASNIAWQLPEQERLDITLAWYRRIVRASAELEKHFLNATFLES